MILVLEIALGIVLGFFMLRHLDLIFSLGVATVMIAIGLAMLGAVISLIYWGAMNEAVLNTAVLVVGMLTIFSIGAVCAHFISKYTGLNNGEAGVFLAMAVMLLGATVAFSSLAYQVESAETTRVLYLFLLPMAGMWVWLGVKTSRLIRKRKAESSTVQVASKS